MYIIMHYSCFRRIVNCLSLWKSRKEPERGGSRRAVTEVRIP